MAYPTTAPSYTITSGAETLNQTGGGTGLSGMLNLFQSDIVALAGKVGTSASTPTANTFLVGTGVGTSVWQGLTSAQLAARISDETGTGALVFGSSPTIVTPTIASFTNAQHNHTNSAGGGKITSAGITSFDTSLTTTSNPYKFLAYRNSAQNTGSSTFAIVNFDTEVFDTNNNFDITTNVGRYTAPVTGFYRFDANVAAIGTTDLLATLYINGAIYAYGDRTTNAANNVNVSIGITVPLTAGNYAEIYSYSSTTRALEVGAAPIKTWWCGNLMSQT